MKKKYPKIEPYYSGKKSDPNAKVLLDYDVYVSILEEIKELEKRYHIVHKQAKKSVSASKIGKKK